MNRLKKIPAFIAFIALISVPVFVSAQGAQIPPSPGSVTTPTPATITTPIQIHNPFNCGLQNNDQCDLPSLIKTILNNIIMPIASVAVVIYIVWAGFQFLVAQGNEKKITEAKSRLLWALIGAGILLGADAIANVVANTITALITTHP